VGDSLSGGIALLTTAVDTTLKDSMDVRSEEDGDELNN
jgi:hypothetical protein